MRPSLLILSFSYIDGDPRVMKQVRRFVRDYDVTTCGPGPRPHPDVVAHVELDPDFAPPRGRVGHLVDDVARELNVFSWSYAHLTMLRQAKKHLRRRRFDAAIANDADTVKLAIDLVGRQRVHADLHEFYPGLPVDDDKLGRRQRRYWTWLTKKHCSRVRSSTTVGQQIADLYSHYGIHPQVVTNAAPFRELSPAPTPSRIRFVHSGNAFRDRGLAEIMRAVASTPTDATLDLYLVKSNHAEFEPLVELAARLGDRITIHDPVPQDRLVDTLSEYDVGIHVLPPTSVNNALALPNKFFDFVQARLAIVVGPSPEMSRIVMENGLGVVTSSFEESSIRAAIDDLTPAAVDAYRQRVDAAARALSAEEQVGGWVRAVAAIVAEGPGR